MLSFDRKLILQIGFFPAFDSHDFTVAYCVLFGDYNGSYRYRNIDRFNQVVVHKSQIDFPCERLFQLSGIIQYIALFETPEFLSEFKQGGIDFIIHKPEFYIVLTPDHAECIDAIQCQCRHGAVSRDV
jgi:hypothetical protein